MMYLVVLLPFLAPQGDDPAALIEKLRSEKAEDRGDAERRLKALGKSALATLETAAKDKDPEVAARAKHLLRVLPIGQQLGVGLTTAFPGIDDRLARGDDHTWTETFLEIARRSWDDDKSFRNLRP